MNLDVRHLRLIVAVTEEKSVTRAGERLHLSQSALSHQLRDIEERLGTPLFLRRNKRMILTQAGERLLQTAHRVLNELQHTEDHILRMADSRQGTLRISTGCYTCYHWLPDLLKEFSSRFPAVEVKIVVEATRRPIQALLQGKLDLAIVSTVERDKQLQSRVLFADELLVVMAPDHPLASRPYVRAGDFSEQHLILYVPREESTVFQKLLLPAGIEPARFSEVQLTEAIIEMVRAGLGISILAGWAVEEQVRAGKIAARRLTRRGLQRNWHAVTLRQGFTPAYIDEFIRLLSRPAMPLRKPGIVRLVSGGK